MNKIEHMLTFKERFSPTNKNHMQLVKEFFRDGRWGQYGCPFYLEWPYGDVPYMLKTKIAEHSLNIS